MDKAEQMFLDNGPNSFLGEVIGIVKVVKLHITMRHKFEVGDTFFIWPDNINTVRVVFSCIDPANDEAYNYVQFGRSYGECLREIRNQLQMEIGR